MSLIDLGEATPWVPPEAPPRRRARARRPRALAVAVLAAAALLGPGADAGAPRGPLLYLDRGVQHVVGGGGRLYVTRYGGPDEHRLEAYSAADGAALWSADLNGGLGVALATADVVMLTGPDGSDGTGEALTVLDARTGAGLWRRSAVSPQGLTAGLVILGEDGAGESAQFLAVDPRSGAEAWRLTVAARAQPAFGYDPRDTRTLTSLSDLGPDGVLHDYDLRTGAVRGTYRLQWSGPIEVFRPGDADAGAAAAGAGSRAGQVLVSSPTGAGIDVFDRESGRVRWHHAADPKTWLYGCARDRWCGYEGRDLMGLDAATGAAVWRSGEYDQLVGGDGEALLLSRFGADGLARPGAVVLDARTGVVLHRVADWRVLPFSFGPAILWRGEADQITTTVGVLDPRSGRIAVLGRSGPWGPGTTCVVEAGAVACSVIGDLTVWRLPAAVRS